MAEPKTVSEVDKQLADYRTILGTVTRPGRVAVWEQIDALLDLRRTFQRAERRRRRSISR